MLGVEDGLDVGGVLGVRHLQIDSHGVQSLGGSVVVGEAGGGADDLVGLLGAAGGEGAGLGDDLGALFRDAPVDEVGGSLSLGRIHVDGQSGHGAQGGAGGSVGGVGVLDHAPVERGVGLGHVGLQGGDEPAAHGQHGALLVLESGRVVQGGGLQVAVVHADAVVLLRQHQVVGGLHEVIGAVHDGVLAVQDGEQGHAGTPGVVVGAVDLGVALAAGHLAGQSVILLHGQVVGGVGHAGGVEQVLVVEQDPEVIAEGHGVEVAVVGGQLLDGAAEIGGVAGQHVVHRGQVVQVDQVGVAGDVLDGQHVDVGSAGQLGGQNGHVIGRAQVQHLDGDVLMAGHIAVGHGLPVCGGLLVPDGPDQVGGAFRSGTGCGRGSRGGSGGGAGIAAAAGSKRSSAGNNGAGLQERTAGNLSHGVCLLEIFFFFFKTGGPHVLHAPASLPIL